MFHLKTDFLYFWYRNSMIMLTAGIAYRSMFSDLRLRSPEDGMKEFLSITVFSTDALTRHNIIDPMYLKSTDLDWILFEILAFIFTFIKEVFVILVVHI
jgi:hypothetical protein